MIHERPVSPEDVAKQVASEYGVTLSSDEAAFILWERTAFPVCDMGYWIKQLRREIESKVA